MTALVPSLGSLASDVAVVETLLPSRWFSVSTNLSTDPGNSWPLTAAAESSGR